MSGHECPTCGAVFDTQRGRGVHHSSVHGERLPNRSCAQCGMEFHCSYERKYCSDGCREKGMSFEGESNPNYRDAEETAECEICGTTFQYYPSEKPGRFCSECVEEASWRTPLEITGEKNPRWGGGTVTLSCDVCDVDFERHPSGITSEVTLCSRDCHRTWLSDAFTGDGHPNWRGGDATPYGKGWNVVREQALDRDGRTCVVCGTDEETLGRNPDVHHLVPVRAFVESPVMTEMDAHTLDNVVSLCPSCHRRAEFGHISKPELRWLAGIGNGSQSNEDAAPAERVKSR